MADITRQLITASPWGIPHSAPNTNVVRDSAGVLHVCLSHAGTTTEIIHLWSDDEGESWSYEAVTPPDGQSFRVYTRNANYAVAISPDDKLVLLVTTYVSTTESYLYCYVREESSWNVELAYTFLQPTNDSQYAVRVDSDGHIHICLNDGVGTSPNVDWDVRYAVSTALTGGSWSSEIVKQETSADWYFKGFSLSTEGKPRVLLWKQVSGTRPVYFTHRDTGSWSAVASLAWLAGTDAVCNLTSDATGDHAVGRAGDGVVHYGLRSGGTWTDESVEIGDGLWTESGDSTVVITDENGTIIVLFDAYDLSNENQPSRVVAVVKQAGAWETMIADAEGDTEDDTLSWGANAAHENPPANGWYFIYLDKDDNVCLSIGLFQTPPATPQQVHHIWLVDPLTGERAILRNAR